MYDTWRSSDGIQATVTTKMWTRSIISTTNIAYCCENQFLLFNITVMQNTNLNTVRLYFLFLLKILSCNPQWHVRWKSYQGISGLSRLTPLKFHKFLICLLIQRLNDFVRAYTVQPTEQSSGPYETLPRWNVRPSTLHDSAPPESPWKSKSINMTTGKPTSQTWS